VHWSSRRRRSLRDGGQRLLDFGIARLHEESAAKNATQSGATMGTPSYMPPEQARGRWEMVDARSDLWAVGATMFALLTGRCVHEAETVNETLLMAMTRPAPPLASVWPQAPASIAAIVDRALAGEMKDRWPDARSMRKAVQEAMQTLAALPPVRAPLASAPKLTMPMTHFTPSGPRGTQLASSVSDRPPVPGAAFATPRGRKLVGISVGAGLAVMGLVVLLLALGHGRGAPAPEVASSPAPPPASTVVAATSLPSAALAPEAPPPAPSASVEIDVSQLPAVSATVAAAPPPPPVIRQRPASVLQPWPSSPPSPVPPPRPASPPTAGLLDRRH
jgi:eukaryotic-like serine/threonine-protein kinase